MFLVRDIIWVVFWKMYRRELGKEMEKSVLDVYLLIIKLEN